jgi:hypothetical protein
MPDLNLLIRYPFQVHFVRKRHRIGELATVWAGGVVVVNRADDADAPAACRIKRARPGHTILFDVRHYDGCFWWPVADENGLVTTSDLERGLMQGRTSCFGLLDGDIVWGGHQNFAEADEFWRSIPVREIKNWGQEKVFGLAQRGASRLLCCGGVVHIKGGEPVVCATPTSNRKGCSTAQIDIVDSEPAPGIGFFCPQSLGRSPARIENSAARGLAFGVDELRVARSILRFENVEIVRRASAEILMPEILRANLSDICVRAAARSLSSSLSHRAMPWTFPGTANLRSRLPILFQQEESLQAEDMQTLAAALVDFTVWCEEDSSRLENFREAYDLVKEGVERMTRAAVQRGRTFLQLDPEDAAAMKGLGC